MSITNGYCSLAELQERLQDMWTYTSNTISFTASTKRIADTDYRLKRFEVSDNVNSLIKVSGTTTNAGVYTVSDCTAGGVTVTETISDEAAGASVTIQKWGHDYAEPMMEQIINATSRWIDQYTGRRFYAATETRYYTPDSYSVCEVDDLLTVTTLKTDQNGDGTYGTTWTANTDYYLWPYNATLEGKPYMEIQQSPNGNYNFDPHIRKSVQVAGSFGFCATGSHPAAVKEACLLLSARWYTRKDAPFGVSGPNAQGEQVIINQFDNDVKWLLRPYRRLV